jgi:hypothetical protein
MESLEKSTGVSNPLVLLQSMIEKGANADNLGKMMDLAERWQLNRAKESFNRAMSACQGEMPAVIEDAKNNQTGGTYALLETVQRVVKPVYTRHGFSLSWSEGPVQGDLRQVIMVVRHIDGYAETHYGHYPIDGEGPKGGRTMNQLQGTVSAHTYAQRDMMRQLFNIVIAGQDVDGENGGLTDDQTIELNTLLEQLQIKNKSGGAAWNEWLARFWKWLGVKDMYGMGQPQFAKAKCELDRLIKGGNGK